MSSSTSALDSSDKALGRTAELTLQLPSSPSLTFQPPASAPPLSNTDAAVDNSKARRQQKKHARQKVFRSVKRTKEKEERDKVSTAAPTETTPLHSGNHLAPHKIRSSVSKAHLNPIVISAPGTPNLRTHSTQPAYVCKRLERSEEKLKSDRFKTVPILSE